jgi:HlyD family secretion protein
LVAPRDGRVQYRLANLGEVLGAGGKVFTMLDTGSVYMDVFLPTADAGRAVVGSDARILLDALPDRPIPATVAFGDPQAQFTPKAVETKSERDKLMFRIRVRVDPELLRQHADKVRTGLPGIAYVRLDPKVGWPARLQPKASG